MMEYTMVRGEQFQMTKFSEAVTELLADGWQLRGPETVVAIAHSNNRSGYSIVYQSLTRTRA